MRDIRIPASSSLGKSSLLRKRQIANALRDAQKPGVKTEDFVPVEPEEKKNAFLKARLRAKLCSLREIVAFQKIPDGLDEVVDKMRLHVVPRGTRIFQQGEEGDRMYIVESGGVEILKSEEGCTGEEVRVGNYQPGECVGHFSLLDSKPRAASAVASKDSVLWSLDRDTLLAFMSQGLEEKGANIKEPQSCMLPPEVFVISDSTGESAVSAVRKAMAQFSHCDGWEMCNIVTYRFVNSKKEIQHIAQQAQRTGAIVVFTLVDPKDKQMLQEEAESRNISLVDLYGPLIDTFESAFGTKISGTPGRKQPVDEDYMDVMDCIEYTRKMDDGSDPSKWDEADLLIVGPSRAGKTPLSFYLSLRGFKVANYPIVVGEDPPEELSKWGHKVIALTIQPERLAYIRQQRMRQFGRSRSAYADIDEVKREVLHIEKFYREHPEWFVIDTTNSGIEETAAEIYRHLDQRSDSIQPKHMRGFV